VRWPIEIFALELAVDAYAHHDALERKGDRLAAAQAQGRFGALMAVETTWRRY